MPRLWIIASLLLAFALPSALSARELQGDWETAGLPMHPMPPVYDFEYSCHAEITDLAERLGDGKEIPQGCPYRLYATTKFTLSRQSSYWSDAQDWKWIAKRLDLRDPGRDLKVLRQAPEGAFLPSTSSAGIMISHVDGKLEDTVRISAQAVLPYGSYKLMEQGVIERTRADERITLRVTAHLARAAGEPQTLPRDLVRSLFISCEKVK